MICCKCGKREVEVMVRQVVGREVHNLNLCRECAEEMGFVAPSASPCITISFSMGGDAEPIKVVKKKRSPRQRREELENSLVCGSCGTEYKSFRETGLLGCAACYEAFRAPLGAYLQDTQGAESHWDGAPLADIAVAGGEDAAPAPRGGGEAEAERLRAELDEAVRAENYERAAELRDRLRGVERGGGGDGD